MLNSQRATHVVACLRVIKVDEAHTVLSYWNVLIVIWYQPPRAALLARLYGLGERLAVELEVPKVSVISIVRRRPHQAPTPPAHAALSELHRDPKNILHRFALVFANEGFIIAGIRSVLLSVRNKLVGSSNLNVFKSFDDAVRWAIEGLRGPDASPLAAASIITSLNEYLAHSENDSPAEAH